MIVTSTMLERPQVDSDILVERFGDSMIAMIVLNQDNRSRSLEISDLISIIFVSSEFSQFFSYRYQIEYIKEYEQLNELSNSVFAKFKSISSSDLVVSDTTQNTRNKMF